jgi:hypothetical protein
MELKQWRTKIMKKVNFLWMAPVIICSCITIILYWAGCQLLKADMVGFGALFLVVAFVASFSVPVILTHMFNKMYPDCNENKIKEV